MIEPVALKDFFITFFAAALVILSGAGYAGLYAWSKLRGKPSLLAWAYACYAVLAASTLVLARTAHLDGEWQILVWLMLAGYLLAPVGIWKLCSTTHPGEHLS